jgi:colanic acid/amylovoran biosynthesis glycosyltransferase
MAREKLLVMASLRAMKMPDGRVVVTDKFVEGMLEYVKLWNGPVATILEPADAASNNLDNTPIDPADLPFDLQILPFDDLRIKGHLAEAGVVLGGADYRQNHLADWCREAGTPYVVNTEYTLATRNQIIASEARNPLRRLRRYIWEAGQERAVRHSIALAAGVQCNGLPTYNAYRPLNAGCHLYFDTRVTDDQFITAPALENRLASLEAAKPLRLAFSGRLIAMKGADHLPRIAQEIRQLGVPFSLSIFGSGDLEPSIRRELARHGLEDLVHLKGVAKFSSELIPYLQQNVDLFVCPHRQGDPSCTYLETLACGVPIAGYANEAWSLLLSTADVGLSAKLDDPKALAQAVASLHHDRTRLATLSRQALDFALPHSFEKTFAARIDHLRQCAARPAGKKAA